MPRTEWYSMAHAVPRNAAARLQPIARHAFRDRSRHRRVFVRGVARPASRHRGDSGAHRAGDDDDHVAPAASPAKHDHRRRVPALVNLLATKSRKHEREFFVHFVSSWLLEGHLNWKLNTKSAPVLLTF